VAPEDGDAGGAEGSARERVRVAHEGTQRWVVVRSRATAVPGRGDGPQFVAELAEATGRRQPSFVDGEEVVVEGAKVDEELVAFDLSLPPLGSAKPGGDAIEHQSAGSG
jgi:hypothetical protein